jgi:hypothetical protein
MKFRILILKDPDAKDRGYSLKGLRLPLTTLCPVKATPKLLSYDGASAYGPHVEYWKVPTSLIAMARPELSRKLRGIDQLLIPTEWCDVAPVHDWSNLHKF